MVTDYSSKIQRLTQKNFSHTVSIDNRPSLYTVFDKHFHTITDYV